MKGVLVVPQVGLYGWNTYATEGRRNNSLPHGLISIATEMNRRGHKVCLVDCRKYGGLNRAVGEILSQGPEFVGIGAMTVDFGIACDLFREIKRLAPHVTTILGGVHATVAPQDATPVEAIDFIVQGEGEWTLPEMAAANFVGYPRVVQGECPDLDALLPIDRELTAYAAGELMHGGGWNTRYPYLTVMSGRGCPHKCAFCWPVSFNLFGPKVRMRSVSHVIGELKFLYRNYKPAFVDFIDDNFTMKPGWVREFITQYKAAGLVGPALNAATRADTALAHPDLFEALRDIGLESVNVGFESGSDRILTLLDKGVTADQNRAAGKLFKGLGLKIIANVMFGFPGETPSETMATLTMLKEMEADYPSPAYFTPYPGCALHERYGKDLLTKNWSELNRHATAPKLAGVDYAAIQTLLRTELRGGL